MMKNYKVPRTVVRLASIILMVPLLTMANDRAAELSLANSFSDSDMNSATSSVSAFNNHNISGLSAVNALSLDCTPPMKESGAALPTSYDIDVEASGFVTWSSLVGANPESITNKIRITGKGTVFIANANLKLESSGAAVVIDGPTLIVNNGNIEVNSSGARFMMNNGVLRTHGNVQQKPFSIISIENSEVEIGDEAADGVFNTKGEASTSADFQNDGGYRYLNNVCMNVTHDYQLQSTGSGTGLNGVDVLINVCVEIGDRGLHHATPTDFGVADGDDSGNFQNSNRMYIYNTDIIIANGNFQNNDGTITFCNLETKLNKSGNFQINSGTFEGQRLCIAAEDIIENSGNWDATISSWYSHKQNSLINIPNGGLESAKEDILNACFTGCCTAEECELDIELGDDLVLCIGEEIVLSPTLSGVSECVGTSSEVSYLWSTGETTPSITVAEAGTYSVIVSDCSACIVEDEITVTVNDKLTIGNFVWVDSNQNGLQDDGASGLNGTSVTLYQNNGTEVASTITANKPDTNEAGYYSFEVCPNSGEYYIVFGNLPDGFELSPANQGDDDTIDSDAGADGRTDSFEVLEEDNLTLDAGLVQPCTINPTINGDVEVCLGEEATITATGGDTYEWNTGATTDSIIVNPTATTTYSVVVSDSTIADCSEELSFTVTVQAVSIDAGADVTIEFGENATLNVSGADTADSILWSTGETTTSIVVTPEITTTYSVTVVNAIGCMDEDSVTVTVSSSCGIEPAFKILPRDQPGNYAPGYDTAACIGDDFYLWMFDPEIDVLNEYNGQDYTQWSFTFTAPNGDVVVQDDRPNYPGNHRFEVLDLAVEDFGDYTISWVAPSGCTGSTVYTLNFPDAGCGDNGVRTSDFYAVDAVYPLPANRGSEITLEISTKSQSINNLTDKGASNGKVPDFVSRKETIKISLYNMSGRLMTAVKTYEVEQGKVKVYYPLGSLPTGNYIIKVNGVNWTESKQIMIN